MISLIDTCVFIKKIIGPQSLIDFTRENYECGINTSTTDKIIDELQPTPNLSEYEKNISTGILNVIDYLKKENEMEIIQVNSKSEYKKNLENIRRRFYTEVTDLTEVKRLISEGKIRKQDVNKAKNKDMGECSLIAVCMTNPNKYTIVTEDAGKVYTKPDINLFESYKLKKGLNVFNYDQWEDYIINLKNTPKTSSNT